MAERSCTDGGPGKGSEHVVVELAGYDLHLLLELWVVRCAAAPLHRWNGRVRLAVSSCVSETADQAAMSPGPTHIDPELLQLLRLLPHLLDTCCAEITGIGTDSNNAIVTSRWAEQQGKQYRQRTSVSLLHR